MGDPDGEPDPRRRVLGLPIWLAVLLGLVIALVIAAALGFAFDSDGESTTPDAADGPVVVGTDPPPPVATESSTTVLSTTAPPTTAPPTSPAPATTATPATTSTAQAATTTDPATTTTTSTIPATVSTEPISATGPEGQRLTVTPRRGPCGTAPDCLVVSFRIDGFTTEPETFVCEFASGRRYEFRFSGDGVDRACATNDVPDSIVVEVGGLRSDPVTNTG